ncbi:MAG TPA: carbohydrate kinase family protein [Anaerovoracaceae bacterium]|nr:carbohydrate kinase family protein [Anaerovoracaceae bacterium]
MDIMCVGEIVADIVVRPVPNIDFTADSMRVEEISVKSGGDAMNTSIDLARLGSRVAFVGKVGRDDFGNMLMDNARAVGVNVDSMAYSDVSSTSRVIALIKENGERCFLHYVGTNDHFEYDDIDLSLLDQCRFLHIGGTFHLPKFDGAGAAALLKLAKGKGLTTTMDVCWDHSGRWAEIIRPCFPYLDYFVPSINEAQHIANTRDIREMAAYFHGNGVKTVVIKLGQEGCYCSTGDRAFRCGSYKVKAVDTTGAGDAFVSGMLSGLNAGFGIEDCIRMGSAVAAFVIQRVGATDGTPDMATLKAYMDNNDLEIIDE